MADYFMNTYHRLSGPAGQTLTFTKGEGARLWDDSGKEYLDFTSGIAVNCLGHNHPVLVKTIAEQAAKLLHVCNYYQSDMGERFAVALVEACAGAGMKRVFLANSGAEANEGACKIARKYSLKKYGPGRHTIVTLRGSFHGRTITTLAATGQDKFHKDFGPFTEGFAYIPGGDIEALEKALDKNKTAGFLLEAIQGESGIIPQSQAYIEAAAKLCAERDILLMFDEIQCGLGRTGTFLACEGYGINADVVTLAKGLAGGVPIGAVLAGEKAAEVFETGDHGSTFGGNPLACAAGLAVLDIVTKPEFLQTIRAKGEKLASTLRSWNHPQITEIRNRGLMAGVDIKAEAWPLLEACLALPGKGLMLLSAGPNTLRFLPPYIVDEAEIDEGLGMLKQVLDKA